MVSPIQKKLFIALIIGVLVGGMIGYGFGLTEGIEICSNVAYKIITKLGIKKDNIEILIDTLIRYYSGFIDDAIE